MREASAVEEEGSKKSIPNIHICLAILARGAQNHTEEPKHCRRVTTASLTTSVSKCCELTDRLVSQTSLACDGTR